MYYFWNVIGHERELSELEEDLKSGNVHHAYLFIGPEKIGKFRVAKAMAGILQCPQNYCHSCPTCIQIEKKCHTDTIELEDDGESIKIQTIRDLIGRLNMTGQARHKIFLIQGVGRMTDDAMNALLKILEEPPSKTIFIFTANQRRDILPTVASRMRIIHFKKLPDAVLKDSLAKLYPQADKETLDQAVLLALGRSGRAIQLLNEPEAFHELRELYRQIQFLDERATPATRFLTVQEISQDPQKMKTFLSLLAHYLRHSMFQESSPQKKQARIRTLVELHRVTDLLDRNVNPRLLLEHLMLQV